MMTLKHPSILSTLFFTSFVQHKNVMEYCKLNTIIDLLYPEKVLGLVVKKQLLYVKTYLESKCCIEAQEEGKMLLGFSLLSFLQGLKKEILVLNCHFLLCLLLYGPHSHSQHHFGHCLCFLHPELKTDISSW